MTFSLRIVTAQEIIFGTQKCLKLFFLYLLFLILLSIDHFVDIDLSIDIALSTTTIISHSLLDSFLYLAFYNLL